MELKEDSSDQIKLKIKVLKETRDSKKLIEIDYRLQQLKLLRAAMIKYKKEIHEADLKDLGIKEFHSHYTVFAICLKELDHTIDNLRSWAKPRSVDTPLLLAPASSYVIPEPFGVCLIFSAWNTQFNTLLMPIATAIAAGNVVLAKPSEIAPASAVVCQKILNELDQGVVETIQGGAEVCIEVLKHRFDIIIFTGSPQKGVLIARSAAEFLTPCILELGGQNPVIVDKSSNLQCAASNLVNGRCMIAGQVCLAPEYVLVERSVYDKLKEQLKQTVETFFNSNPKESQDFPRIINEFHTKRLAKLIDDTKKHNLGKVLYGGDYDISNKFISPTSFAYDSIKDLSTSPLSAGEIFGPIQYLAPYDNLSEALKYINSKEKPLALYYFGSNNTNFKEIESFTSSGAILTNDTVAHFSNSDLPFGGVGNSGYSACHGKYGFESVSHMKPVMVRKAQVVPFRYPPFNDTRKTILTFLLKLKTTQSSFVKFLIFSVVFFVSLYYSSTLINIGKNLVKNFN